MERHLGDGRPYLLGDDFRAPDLLLTTCLDWARYVDLALPDTLDAYRHRIAERPAYAEALAANRPPRAA